MSRDALINELLKSENPSVRWKLRVGVLDDDPKSRAIKKIQDEIRTSPTVKALLAKRNKKGEIDTKRSANDGWGVYHGWQGAHWVFAALGDIGYPAGDDSLKPLRDQVFACWLRDMFFTEFEANTRAAAYKGHHHGVPVMQGRHRRCASQQGNALLSAARLGLLDSDADRLVERLLHWQWPDGGWNCDKDPNADTSSFMESVLPMQALALYGAQRKNAGAKKAARKAADVFLSRKLFKRRSDGAIIKADFTHLHYPLYWHYDILGGLKAMANLGLADHKKCADALDLLEEKELDAGGWVAEARYFKPSTDLKSGCDYVDWGSGKRGAMNEWVTADALCVLHAAGRL
jgi:hypothetical protein